MAKNNNVIYGRHAVLLACNNRDPSDIMRILIAKQEDRALFKPAISGKIEILNAVEMSKIAQNNGGFICLTKSIRTVIENDLYNAQNIIALDCIHDVGNIGAIIRTAAAFGVEGIIYGTDKAPDIANNPTVHKASSGGVELLKLCPVVNLHRTLENLKKNGFWVIGADMSGTHVNHVAKRYENDKKVIVLGNEEHGVRTIIKSSCDVIASIPIAPDIESLNVSVAAGILIHTLCNKTLTLE